MKIRFLTLIVCFSTISLFAAEPATVRVFNIALKSYYQTKNALSKDDFNSAVRGAAMIVKSLKTFPVRNLTYEQKQVWDENIDGINTAAKAIANEKQDIAAQRKQFERLTASMIRFVKGMKLNDTIAYVQYCPMVKASWLNEVKEIQNPYYGSQMFSCGSVKEIINKP